MQSEESFLGDIVSFDAVARDPSRQRQNEACVPAHEFVESALVAGLSPAQEIGVRWGNPPNPASSRPGAVIILTGPCVSARA